MEISKVYEQLTEFLNKISVTEYWEVNESSSLAGDDDEPIMEYHYILLNKLNRITFLGKMDTILSNTFIEIGKIIDLNNISKKEIEEIGKIIDVTISNLQAKKTLYIDNSINQKYYSQIDDIIGDIIKELQNHKNCYSTSIPVQTTKEFNYPVQWNENINKLVDIFYQLTEELKNGEKKPLIKTSKSNLANFIVNNFVDKSGHSLNYETINTILKESKADKRPSLDKRIGISYIPM